MRSSQTNEPAKRCEEVLHQTGGDSREGRRGGLDKIHNQLSIWYANLDNSILSKIDEIRLKAAEGKPDVKNKKKC